MKKILNLFKGDAMERHLLAKTLQQVVKSRLPMRVEVENSNFSFTSVVTHLEGMLVVARPPGLGEMVTRGTRLCIPFQGEGHQPHRLLRVEVTHPNLNLSNGNAVILCRLPKQMDTSNRKHPRHATHHLKGITVRLGISTEHFRVGDVSANGVRLLVPMGNLESLFPLGKDLGIGQFIIKGHGLHVRSITPKTHQGRLVGCHMELAPEAQPTLDKLIQFLEINQQKTLIKKDDNTPQSA